MSFGASWGDFNSDGWPDLWVNNHWDPNTLYLNQGNGTFINLPDVISGTHPYADSHGAAWGDLDNDGDQDIMEMVGAERGEGVGRDHLLINENGLLTNQAVEMGLDDPYGRGRTPFWFDWSGDGRLDLLLTNLARADEQSPTTCMSKSTAGFK
jgi:hypothetical protein